MVLRRLDMEKMVAGTCRVLFSAPGLTLGCQKLDPRKLLASSTRSRNLDKAVVVGELYMHQTAQYVLIGGTILLLGSAVACFVIASVIRIYIVTKYGVNDLVRFWTYARSEAPPSLHVAQKYFNRLIIAWLLLVLANILFTAFMFRCFSNPSGTH